MVGLDGEILGRVRTAPSVCPILPLPTSEQVKIIMGKANGEAELDKYLQAREQRIAEADEVKGDPYNAGFDLDCWADADRLLAENDVLMVFGGNRSGKSEWAAKRVMQSSMLNNMSIMWCFQDSEATSIGMQQKQVWKYLPRHYKTNNQKKNPLYKLRYSVAMGFTERKLILPTCRSELHFLTYNQDPSDYQGWEIGAPPPLTTDHLLKPNIAAWADENLNMRWLETILFRMATRGGKLIWTYTPLLGITPAIRELLGSCEIVEHRPAELLADRDNVPGCPRGTMPYIVKGSRPRVAAIFFHSHMNPFGGYAQIKKLCEGKPSDYVERHAYGWARDTAHRALPLFGAWNIVAPDKVPTRGTNYHLTDPAGSRNWATIWVRVAPGNPSSLYVYREWPDLPRFGEWATPSDDARKFDGSSGPAQTGLGLGVDGYRKLFLNEEKGEIIYERFIDPRAGRNAQVAIKGGTCLTDMFAMASLDEKTGNVTSPPMIFTPASGIHIEDGISEVNSLLEWTPTQPMVWPTNSPRLFVSSECRNLIWAMNNYTGLDGEHGACKDFIDLLRYMATASLRYVDLKRESTTTWGY